LHKRCHPAEIEEEEELPLLGLDVECYTQIKDAFGRLVQPIMLRKLPEDEACQTQVNNTSIKCKGRQLEKAATIRVRFSLLLNNL
jgi:hypothetical protein